MKPQEISVIQTNAGNSDSTSYLEATDARWLDRWIGLGLCSVPLSASAMDDKSMVSWVAEGGHPDTVQCVTENEMVNDEMLLREIERISSHLFQAHLQFDEATIRALYSNPEQLYL